MIDQDHFLTWLSRLKVAVEKPDAEDFVALFSDDVTFYDAPFQAPRRGRLALQMAIEEMGRNRSGSTFKTEFIRTDEDAGWAMWANSFTRAGTDDPVRLEGILKASFDEDGLCREFRQWWHKLEPGQDDLMRDFDA
ncbi:MAG: nuclear transport factor 2 family protein [Henriciella sp.]|uniref:nuclear transport factor 2 family protein n=1 Tax=Henriciella sp. TaxID=1968823 RepID=UPI003C73FE1B